MLAELIQQHPELKIREKGSEFLEDQKGRLFVRAKENNDTILEVIYGENQQLITKDIPKTEIN